MKEKSFVFFTSYTLILYTNSEEVRAWSTHSRLLATATYAVAICWRGDAVTH